MLNIIAYMKSFKSEHFGGKISYWNLVNYYNLGIIIK